VNEEQLFVTELMLKDDILLV